VAGAETVELQSGEASIRLGRGTWHRDLHISETGSQRVVRFQGPDQEVGFIVSADEAERLLRALQLEPVTVSAREPSPTRPSREGPAWPVVTHGTVWSLACAALAFVPWVGPAFAAVSLGLAVHFLMRGRQTLALRHARYMATIAIVWAVLGTAVSVLAAWSSLHPIQLDTSRAPRSPWAAAAAGIFVIVIALSVHEAAHAITAWWLGDDLARSQGRVTLNPLAHLHPFGSLLLPLLLVQAGMSPFGFARPVPVELGNVRRYRRAHILISIAGPGSNLLQAALCMMILVAIGCILPRLAPGVSIRGLSNPHGSVSVTGCMGATAWTAALMMLKLGFEVNVLLAAFNLIPIPPLDGSWVMEHLFPNTLGRFYAWIRPYGFLLFLGLVYADGLLAWLLLPGYVTTGIGYLVLWWSTGI